MTPHSGSSRLRGHAGIVALVATACLLLGSTGGALAGSMITGSQIKNSSLTGKDVKDKSLTEKDLSPSAVEALTGPPGSPGAPGQNAYQDVDGAQLVVLANTAGQPTVSCPAGTTLLGANFRTVSGSVDTGAGGPSGELTWQLILNNPSAVDATVVPYAICTRP